MDRGAVESRHRDGQAHQDLDTRHCCNHHRRYQEHQAHQDAAGWLALDEHGLDKSADQA